MVPTATTQRLCHGPDLAWNVCADVEGRVERPTRQQAEVGVAIGEQVSCLGKELRSGPTPVQQRHLVTGCKRRLCHRATDEPGASDEEHAHGSEAYARAVDGPRLG
jgi:hypothetical protein